MVLAQVVLQILCWQCSIGLQCISRKRSTIQSNIYRNLPKVNQVNYTLDTISEPNIMVLAQVVLQILCWQCSIGLQCMSRKRSTIQSNIYRNLPKVNQVNYTLDKISEPNIMVLAQVVLQILCWQCSIGLQCISRKRSTIQSNIYRNLPKVNQVNNTLDTISEPNIMVLAQAVRQIFCWQGSKNLQHVSRKRGIIQSNTMGDKRYAQKCYKILNFYSIATKFDTYKL